MKNEDADEVARLADEVHRALLSLLNQSDAVVGQSELDLLERFSTLAHDSPRFKVASEKARSLVSLLTDRSAQFLDDLIYVQMLAIAQSMEDSVFAEDMNPDGRALHPLVTPVPPSEARQSDELAVFVENPALLEVLRRVAKQAGFSVTRLGELNEVSALDETKCPAAIIAELRLFQLNPNATTAVRGLRHRLLQPPHLFLLGKPDDISARLDAVRLGATRFISMPLDVSRLVSVLKGVTLKTVPRPYRVLLIDDDRMFSKAHEFALNKAGIETLALSNPLVAPIEIVRFQPDVIVSDIFMQGCNGLELLAVIRQDDSLSDTPMIFLTSESDPRRRIEALDLGGDDFLSKPVSIPLFVATVVAHAKRSRRLKRTRQDLHEFFNQIRSGELGVNNPLTQARIIEIQEELRPLNLIPSEDYVVSEHGEDVR